VTILEGGRIVQTGTGLDIVERPADDYVAEFVRHVNPRTAIKGAAIAPTRRRRVAPVQAVGAPVLVAARRGRMMGPDDAPFSGLSLLIRGLSGQRGWTAQWRSPGPGRL